MQLKDLLRRRNRLLQRMESSEGKLLSNHGHWQLGYFVGQLSLIEDMLDILYPDWEH